MNKTAYQTEQDYKNYALRVEQSMHRLGASNPLCRSAVASNREFVERGFNADREPSNIAKTLYQKYANR